MLAVIPIETPTLGDRSYLVHDGRDALVVDPQRDIDRVQQLLDEHGVTLRHVFETHIHNDYVTGGRALAAATGAAYHVNAADAVAFECSPIADGDVIQVWATASVRAVATPGHTFTHLSYVLYDAGRPVGVFTGGSLLFGSTGRPDLLGPDATDELVHAQYRSAHRLADLLPDAAAVHPTHGFGSFCSATQAEGTSSTIGDERRSNPVLTRDEHAFAREILAGLDAFPSYYAHMGRANLHASAAPPDLSPPERADGSQLRRRIEAGEWVVDLRGRAAFAAGHLGGSLNVGLDGSFATYLGWVIPWGTPVTLLGETSAQVAEAQRELVRIGIDRPAAAAAGPVEDHTGGAPLRSLRVVTFADLERERSGRSLAVLDVRRRLEWNDAHVAGAVHLPFHELPDRMAEVPDGEVWVHCATGYRAAIAASMIAAATGRDVVLVDDEFDNAASAGVRLETPSEPAVA